MTTPADEWHSPCEDPFRTIWFDFVISRHTTGIIQPADKRFFVPQCNLKHMWEEELNALANADINLYLWLLDEHLPFKLYLRGDPRSPFTSLIHAMDFWEMHHNTEERLAKWMLSVKWPTLTKFPSYVSRYYK